MSQSLLVLGRGDSLETDKNRIRLVEYAAQAGFEVQAADYHELKQLHQFRNKNLNIIPFFPYTFWNKNCETPEDTLLYGTSKRTYGLFMDFFLSVKDKLEQKFSSHNLVFAIPLESAAVDRDKLQTIQILRDGGVSTSETVSYGSLSDILARMTPERGVFIKCRYGAEGKGITLIRPDRWLTNYKVENSRLTNYEVYGRWNFTDITGKKELLEQLIEQEVIVEPEVVSPHLFGSKNFDFRIYVINGAVPHFFVRINDFKNVITNWSQGGRVIHNPKTELAEKVIERISGEAKKAAMAFHSKLLGVDVMLERDGDIPKVIELQTFTGFPDIRKFDLANYLVRSGFFR